MAQKVARITLDSRSNSPALDRMRVKKASLPTNSYTTHQSKKENKATYSIDRRYTVDDRTSLPIKGYDKIISRLRGAQEEKKK